MNPPPPQTCSLCGKPVTAITGYIVQLTTANVICIDCFEDGGKTEPSNRPPGPAVRTDRADQTPGTI